MKLPNNAVGITDLIAYRECARRMSYGLRRHVGQGKQDDAATPEKSESAASHAAAYGSCIHEAIALTEDGYSDADAIQEAWGLHGRLLYPEDLAQLADDLRLYHTRDFPGMKTILSEGEVRIPLMAWENGQRIYFRGKIDRLYQSESDPGTFIMVDYKSSSWPKSEVEVHADLQMWAYNWAIHEQYPECDNLIQVYDQLRYGQIHTQKTAEQRVAMKRWLQAQTTALLNDENYGPDGLLKPTFNQWCPWCPILNDCPVVPQLSEYAQTRISALQPRRAKKKKDGSDSLVTETAPLDKDRVSEYAAELDKVKTAAATLKRFDESVRTLLRELPATEREAVGWTLRPRNNKVFDRAAKLAIYDALGDQFFDVVSVSQTSLESALGDDPGMQTFLLGLAQTVLGTPAVVPGNRSDRRETSDAATKGVANRAGSSSGTDGDQAQSDRGRTDVG